MQFQQLRYLIAAADHRSFRSAAQASFVSQSTLSVAIKDLEQELGLSIFERTSRGTTLTPEGAELVERAREIIERLDAMEGMYSRGKDGAEDARLAVSSQHYSLVVDAFGDFVSSHADIPCSYTLRESYTNEIIRDVQERRSDMGVIYLSNYNDRVISRALAAADLGFTSLYIAQPHIIVRADHPLASKKKTALKELERYPRFAQEQGMESSSYFAEEPLAATPCIKKLTVSDNGTLSTLLARTNGYALGTGAFPNENGRFASIPIDTDEVMNIGFIRRFDTPLSPFADEFLHLLSKRIIAFDGPIEASSYTYEHSEMQ